MAEFLFQRRVRWASAAVLVGPAVIALLGAASLERPGGPGPRLIVLALVLLAGTLVCAAYPWDRAPVSHRVAPPLLGIAVTGVAAASVDLGATAHAEIGLTATALIILTGTGLLLPPGSVLAIAPLLVAVGAVARARHPEQVSLALPLLAVPLAAAVGELVAALLDRSAADAERERRRQSQLACLEAGLRQFGHPASFADAAQQVAEVACETFSSPRATVVLKDPAGHLVTVTRGPVTTEPDARTRRLLVDAVGGREPRLVRPADGRALLVLPILGTAGPVGAVVLTPELDDGDERTLDLAGLFAVQVGIAVDHLRLVDELARDATRDALTGIGNRRHATTLLDSLQDGDAVILLDLDNFKRINDTEGHAAGDELLQRLSRHLRSALRDSDTSARLGGDEFLIVARSAMADPLAVAERILSGWARQSQRTTLSAGVALHEPGHSPDETLARADAALYDAKAAGKNRAMVYDPERNGQATV
jgi:diguanylate cyclase (GGDEF)-like protein